MSEQQADTRIAITGFYNRNGVNPPLHFGPLIMEKHELADWMIRTGASVLLVEPLSKVIQAAAAFTEKRKRLAGMMQENAA